MAGITLQGRNLHILKAGEKGFLVKSGEVIVTLQPYRGNRPLRRLYLGTAKIGDYIPAPFCDTLNDGKEDLPVVFLLSSNAEAVLDGVLPEREWSDIYRAYLEGSYFALDEVNFYDTNKFYDDAPESGAQFWDTITNLYVMRGVRTGEALKARRTERERVRGNIRRGLILPFTSRFKYRMMRLEPHDNGLYDAAAFLCAYNHIDCAPYSYITKGCKDDYTIDDIARLSGFPVRRVRLKDGWDKNVAAAFLCFLHKDETSEPMIIYPRFGRLYLYDASTRETRRCSRTDMERMEPWAYVFDRTFGKEAITLKEVIGFCLKDLSVADVVILSFATILMAQVGVAFSVLNQAIYGDIIPGGDEGLAFGLGIIFLAALIANFFISIAKNLTDYRIGTRFKNAVQIAVFERVFHLPENYFRKKEGASEAYRITLLSDNYAAVIKMGWDIIVEVVFAAFYLRRMFNCSPALSVIGLTVAAAMVAVTAVFGILLRQTSRVRIAQTSDIRSFLYQIFMGIGTIRTAGATDAAALKYMEKEVILQRNQRKSDRLQMINTLLFSALNALCMLAMYQRMGSRTAESIPLGVFMGFISANTMFVTSITQLTNGLSMASAMKPLLKDAGEFLKLRPEGGDEGMPVPDIRGDIALSHVTFGYEGTKKPVINDLSLTIRKGEYVGIAGYSGCGKSTLLRLLLGFEKPADGQIYYDGISLSRLSLPELRRKIGAVLQDGSLISGSILENVTIARAEASEDEVQKALFAAGLQDEIAAMPMGLLTHVSEEALTISGGQKQRILIARAIIGNPRLMLFDEATSSLDNISQEKISDALAEIPATRIVVAHRLSTLKLCDRILVMDQGRIMEEGTYNELMERKGRFYEMVKIQQAV